MYKRPTVINGPHCRLVFGESIAKDGRRTYVVSILRATICRITFYSVDKALFTFFNDPDVIW